MSEDQADGQGGEAQETTDNHDRKEAARAQRRAERQERRRAERAEKARELQGELTRTRAELTAVTSALEQAKGERDALRAQRLEVQETLGAQHGKRVLPRLKVEKTNGVPSFVVGQRMMQRVFRRTEDPAAGLDGVGAVFADRVGTTRFARSHGVPIAADEAAPGLLVHAFQGEVGLVEVVGADGVRHLTPDGNDPGDIRPAVRHDPELPVPEHLAQICAWAGTLSAHIPRPYVQLHWTTGPDPSLVRIDPDPDRIPVLEPEWDERLGAFFDGAYARFLLQPYRSGGLDNQVPDGAPSDEEER